MERGREGGREREEGREREKFALYVSTKANLRREEIEKKEVGGKLEGRFHIVFAIAVNQVEATTTRGGQQSVWMSAVITSTHNE